MKSPQERSAKWANTPEPDPQQFDPQTILDTGGSYDAYLWHSMHSSEQWLAYEGNLAEITR